MNWGYKILIVYAVFILGIVSMVVKSSTQNTDIVTTDYYAKELKYQQRIDEMKRVSALSVPVEYAIKEQTLVIKFPKDFTGKRLSGEVVLYYPADKQKDFKQSFSVQDELVRVPLSQSSTGLYELQLSWQQDGVTYYFEKKIFL